MIWMTSTEDKKWFSQTPLAKSESEELVIGSPMGQPLFGFGCCFSETCVKAVLNLSPEKKDEVFDELFTEDGCGFSYCRLSIGANDFVENWYSYNEVEGDYVMENFSIERDRRYIIPAVKEAYKRAPHLSFFASPWSPPTWMKFPAVCNYGRLIQTPENLKAYAKYFRLFLEAYAKEGIRVDHICPQNEFLSDQKWPSCVFSGEEMENLVCAMSDEIGDLAQIYIGTIDGPRQYTEFGLHGEMLGRIMQNPKCRQAVKGAAYQWAGKLAIMQAHEDYPELDLIHSECQCGDGTNTWDYAMYNYHMYHHYFRFGARANVYWNMALDGERMSAWGWKQNSLITIADGEYAFTPDFYMVKHFSHFVKPGAVLLRTQGDMSSNTCAFRNPDGSTVVVMLNPFPFEKKVTIGEHTYALPPRSFHSIIL